MTGAHSPGADAPKGAEADMYSLSTTQNDDDIDRPSSPDESTRLLGAGTRASYNPNGTSTSPDSDAEAGSPSGEDTWVGHKEYEHLPWYQRPSVCDIS